MYINIVPMSHYLVSVVGHEMSNSWPVEALKAQAVVSRSYAAVKMQDVSEKGYDVDTTMNHQVYRGIPSKRDRLEEAVRSTQGELLIYDSELARVFFHSSCGGRLEAAHEIWKEKIDYLKVKRSDFCRRTPHYRWTLKTPEKEMSRLIGVKRIQQIQVAARTTSGRAKEITISSQGKKIKLDPVKFRKALGPSRLKSYFFDIRLRGNEVQISGRGYGHGVGMCQWGSRLMSERHKMNYRKILRHFFPGVSRTKSLSYFSSL